MHYRVALTLTVLLLSACPAETPTPSSNDASGTPDTVPTTTCEPSSGGFEPVASRFDFDANSWWLQLTGAVQDGQPIEFHSESDRQGSCRLMTYGADSWTPACDPPCAAGEACVIDACVAYPTWVSAGSLTLEGVPGTPTVTANGTGGYYWATEDHGADALTSVTLKAAGGDTEPFELTTCVVAPPTMVGAWDEQLANRAAGADVTLTWSNPYPTARVYLRMTTCVGTHGGISPVELECEGPDTGTLTLPGAFLDALYEPSLWGHGECGSNSLWRYHATDVQLGDRTIQLRSRGGAGFWYLP